MWSLSENDLNFLFMGSKKYKHDKLTSLLGPGKNFTTEELDAFLARPDLGTILRMFWVVRLVYDTLSVKNEDDLEFATHIDNLFHEGGFREKDKALVRSFDDSAKILEYIYEYRTQLFAPGRRVTEPPAPASREQDKLVPSQSGKADVGVVDEEVDEEVIGDEDTLFMEQFNKHLDDPNFAESVKAIVNGNTADNKDAQELQRSLTSQLDIDGEELIRKLSHVRENLRLDDGGLPEDFRDEDDEHDDEDDEHRDVHADEVNNDDVDVQVAAGSSKKGEKKGGAEDSDKTEKPSMKAAPGSGELN